MLSNDKKSGVSVVNNMATEEPKALLDFQLEYLLWSSETKTSSDHRMWFATTDYGSPYRMKYEDYIVSENDVQELAHIFYASYERAGDSEKVVQLRKKYAEEWYKILKRDE